MTKNNKNIEQRLGALEKRIAKLEKAAVLFEEHRQAWIEMNKGLKKLKQEMDHNKGKELARQKRIEEKRRKKGFPLSVSSPLPPLQSDGMRRRVR